MKHTILISGKQGAGKTTLANYLVSILPKATKISFADPMRAMVRGMLAAAKEIGLDLPDPLETRSLMQFLGTPFGRDEIDDLLWVKYAKKRIDEDHEHNIFILDDVRFINEVEAFPSAVRIRLECQVELREKRAKYWGNPDHISETQLDTFKFDGVFDTSGPQEQTTHAVRNWLEYKTKLI